MKRTIVVMAMLLLSGPVLALDAASQRYIDQMTQGGMGSVRDAAQSMYNTGESNTQVLDVAAEVLLQNYKKSTEYDTLAWVAKALGKSKNGRYYSVLKEVADSKTDKKLTKYTEAAMKEIGSASGAQYTQGTVNLTALRNKKTPASTTTASKGSKSGSGKGLEVIRKGMSMDEAYNLVGPPTSSSAHPTGKAFIPFNFKGGDTVRSYALYKGKGSIVFSQDSHYSNTMHVIEVNIDPNESGYR